MINSIINERYRLDEEIGHGGMGVVYRAYDMTLAREVALKLLSQQEVGTEGRARLIREAQTVAKMDHPNIVSVFDAGEYQKSPYIVMPFIEGRTLREYQTDDLDEIIEIVRQICLALDHAHNNGIIHRDLKPENIVRTNEGVIKLMDFGLALSVASRLSTEGTVVGTAIYMPPEQVQGDDIGPQADLYSLGIMMYEMVTQTLPFNADNLIGLITQHIHAPVVPPRAKREDLPAYLSDLIVKLLSKNPADRPPNAASVYNAVNQTEILETQSDSTELSVLDRIVRGRLVGRENELQEAQNLWRKVQNGSGQVLLVSGEPGIGKTRLVKEIATLAEVSGGKVFQAASYQEGAAPYEMISQVIRTSLSPQNKLNDFPEPVLADMLSITPDLKANYPEVSPNPSLEPQQEKQRLHENLIRFLKQISSDNHVLLLFEDIHWSDNSSLRFVQHLMRNTAHLPILLLMTYREVELEQSGPINDLLLALHRERLGHRIKLQRLDIENTKSMLQVIFAEDITDDFTEGIYQETEGNPFFIEEVCKAMVESGQLYFEAGEWHRPQNMKDLNIPQSIRVVIQSRLTKLEKPHQEVLMMAALFGHEFNYVELQHAIDKDEDILIDSLEAAENRQRFWRQLCLCPCINSCCSCR
jgi:serine/threonine protein kinase